MLPIARQQNV